MAWCFVRHGLARFSCLLFLQREKKATQGKELYCMVRYCRAVSGVVGLCVVGSCQVVQGNVMQTQGVDKKWKK